ncbi:hypothetical protein RclHR1_24910002 [Rhizophagus clarus]|uniref:RRM domain-containing protein n=1 Tax=Rhizophagus clarus TaxID=94130 RepID=A0A2Z6RE06_9GLOM|nr:hypothetical protein RclHR1_24910002 [Rhizophagus clarus]
MKISKPFKLQTFLSSLPKTMSYFTSKNLVILHPVKFTPENMPKVTPCHYTVDQNSSRHAFVITLTQLPPNTKDIDLTPLIRELGAKVVNVPLSLNSYKPKRWAYITFPSQELMDAAIEQLISYQGHTLQWNLPDNTNKLYHRYGKLGYAPSQCPLHQQ